MLAHKGDNSWSPTVDKKKLQATKLPYSDIAQVRDLVTLSLKWDVSIKSFPSGLRKPHRREGRKSLRTRGDGGNQENKAL